MIVIGVSGWKGSGKDTMADYLIKDYGYKRLAFADVLKRMTAEQYNFNLKMCHDTALKEQPLIQYPVETKDNFSAMIHKFMIKEFRSKDGRVPVSILNDGQGFFAEGERYSPIYWTPRALLILEGSIKRSVNTEYWVQNVVNYIQNNSDRHSKYIITDLRYKSEVGQLDHAFHNKFITCRIKRDSDSPSNDPSERDLDDFPMDYVLSNYGSLEDFYENVDDVVSVIEGSLL